MEHDLARIEAAVQLAIRRRDTESLRVLGHGEISLVLGWPSDEPVHAVKRVPPFRDAASAARYIDECRRSFALLDDAGVGRLETELLIHRRPDGRAVVFHRQPIADAAQLGTAVLRATPPTPDHPLIVAVADAAERVCSPTVGFDVQMANWLWDGSTARQIDFTSPFMIDATGRDLTYDSRAFLQEYPLVLRPYLKRELLGLVRRFTTAEGALGDMVANLLKEGLEAWVDPVVATINTRLGTRLSRAGSQAMLDADRALLPTVLKIKKAQRWWLGHTGRRYEQLLPEVTTYGL